MAMEIEGSYTAYKGDGEPQRRRLWELIVVASIAGGIQFGWALQLSLLTPYVQQLGVPHAAASFIWLCGPISGLIVQPVAGHFSDHCKSRFGRRRPFIVSGAALVIVAVFLIGFAADIGHRLGDRLDRETKPFAVGFFVVGFWILDVANNTLQGPCRAFLADLSGGDQQMIRYGNYSFAFFMALGNILGYGAGTIKNLHKVLPFTATTACDVYCANLKTCFIIDVFLLLIVTTVAVILVKETPFTETSTDSGFLHFLKQFGASMKGLEKPMWLLFIVTALNWIGWFPFLLYDTDWVGLQVYGGNPHGDAKEKNLYDVGVRAGAMGLLLNSVVLGFFSLLIMLLEQVSNWAKSLKSFWGVVNIILATCLILTIPVTKAAEHWRKLHGVVPPPSNIKGYTIGLFSVLGIPLAVNFSVPFALASIYSSTSSSSTGQGLSLGLLNLAIVIPQMFVSVVSGYLDKLGGGGNLPAFIMGAVAAALSSLLAFTILPKPSPQASATMMMGGH